MTNQTTSIKGVDRETWRLFKAEAARHGMPMGKFLSDVVKEHAMNESKNNWNEILEYAGSISGEEARRMKKEAAKMRKSFSLRHYDAGS